jgi:glycosyltransferase involved in cell wall biosynthesis
MPRITVVFPVYNHQTYLEEALQSIFTQDYTDFQVVAVDDDSTDTSLDVLSRYEPRLTLIRSEHRGPAAARNRAIENTDSEYIAFMDADDISEPRRFGLELRKLQNNNLDLAASALSFIDEWGWPIPGLWACPPHARNHYWASLLERNWIGTPSVMLRRSALTSAGVFDEEFTHSEDYDLWLRVGQAHSIGYIEAPLVQCRRHRKNTSIDIDSHQRFERKALQKVNPSDAWQAFSRLYTREQKHSEAWIWFLLRSASPAFLDEAHAALARNPHSSALRFALGVFHYDSMDYEKARASFLGIAEQDAASIHNVGVAAALCGDVVDAQMKFNAALHVQPGYYDAHYNLDALRNGKTLRLTRRPLRANLVPIRHG